jgi:butyrate kinase
MHRILTINPGATSTKLAVFDDAQPIFQETVEHQGRALAAFAHVTDQFDYRLGLILAALSRAGIDLETLAAVAGRGGLLRSLAGGTYRVNDAMLADLKAAQRGEHASNLGALLADAIGRKAGVPAYIVDPVSVDELEPEARLSGLPELPRISFSHALNSRAVAHQVAEGMDRRYEDVNLVVAHLGTGVSVSAHRRGRMIDVNNGQEEGPFSPDRCGGLPARSLVRLCYSGKHTEKEMIARIMGSGGLFAYLGTRDVREAEARAAAGDQEAEVVLKAMTYQIAKEIGAMAASLCGEVDRIVLTGGIAYSHRVVAEIKARVAFIAPVVVVPGEEELRSLAAGVLRVLCSHEAARTY